MKLRAEVLARVRSFFYQRGVLEVETPVLSCAAVSDPNLQSLWASASNEPEADRYYLHTSPEFPMKRLLANGSGPIFQLARVFRGGESGRRHNPEFTLLEWYRPGYGYRGLMDEVDELLAFLLETDHCISQSYKEVFESHAGIDPHRAARKELEQAVIALDLDLSLDGTEESTIFLDLIMSHRIIPQLGMERPVLVYDYPVNQSSYAVVRNDNPAVAERFEVFLRGMELGNGYSELTDPVELRRRFVTENGLRRQRGLPEMPIDERLLLALDHGLQPCAGVAVGFDRLLMIAAGADDIAKVMAFSTERA